MHNKHQLHNYVVEPTTSDLSDPCEQQPCDTNAVCTAEAGGSFTCICIPPFVGNGFTCSTIDIGMLIYNTNQYACLLNCSTSFLIMRFSRGMVCS